jgi:signal transduction histidine kinase
MPAADQTPFPPDLLAEGVAAVGGDGDLSAPNAAMRSLLTACGDGSAVKSLAALPIDAAAQAQLQAGDAVCASLGGREWELRLHGTGERRWLCARDIDDRQRAETMAMAAARVRLLGRVAGSIVHDLNNLLGSAMGLASLLGPLASDPTDQRLIEEMQRGVQRGADLARALARMLKAMPRQWVVAAPGKLVEEAMVVSVRAAGAQGVELTSAVAEQLPSVRVVAAEVTQALLHGILALVDTSPRRIVVEARAERRAVADGRERTCAVVRLVATGCARAIRADAASSSDWQTSATLLQRRAGGDLVVASSAHTCTIDYVWPACAAD